MSCPSWNTFDANGDSWLTFYQDGALVHIDPDTGLAGTPVAPLSGEQPFDLHPELVAITENTEPATWGDRIVTVRADGTCERIPPQVTASTIYEGMADGLAVADPANIVTNRTVRLFGATIRNFGGTWGFVGAHGPVGFNEVVTTNTYVEVQWPLTNNVEFPSFIATPDDLFAGQNVTVGASVSGGFARLTFGDSGGNVVDPTTLDQTGNVWLFMMAITT